MLDEFLGQTDILICLLPSTPETKNMLNSNTFSCLPQGAAIINAARGAMINEADLLDALETGHVRGAFLDVDASENPHHPTYCGSDANRGIGRADYPQY